MPRRVVYTCMFGYSEPFNDFVYEPADDIDFICFTDDPDLRSPFWRMQRLPRGLLDPVRAAKRVKILAHRHVSEYDESLYLDNLVRLKQPPGELFDRFLTPSASPLVCFRHPNRNCIYDEARLVQELGFDDPARIEAQMQFYRRLGYPPNNGLMKSGFLLRRHSDPSVIRLMETWFEQVLCFSLRDQLSFMVAAWALQFRPHVIELDFEHNDVLDWPVPESLIRVPRDFNDEAYLQLNPDLRAAGMDPRKHYLLHGAGEGRRYK